ncbi:DUF6010 family protein [Aurantiacibacter flavus]|uniref:DUF6010 family protein n=1 Tax=Aurantiacibacter flavus TaxID=3145232 RepID=A0ABV0CZR0_9SPHN
MPPFTPTPVTVIEVVAPVIVAFLFIALCGILREPTRQQFSAVFVGGAGAAYLSGGFGLLELVFTAIITLLSLRGLRDYRAIGVAWLLHSGWDLMHDWWGNPILPFVPNSSFGCFVCDPVIAIWYFLGAPTFWRRARQST